MAYEIKERSLSEILDGAFQLYRNHFSVFLGVAVWVTVPTILLGALSSFALTGHADLAQAVEAETRKAQLGDGSVTGAVVPFGRAMLATFLVLPFSILGQVLQGAALTLAVSDAYLGEQPSMGASFQRAFRLIGPLIGAWLLAIAGMGLGLLCFILPAIFLGIRWMFITPAIVLEGNGATGALARSRDLAADNYGRLFVLFVILLLIGIGLQLAVGALIPEALQSIPMLGSLLQQIPAILVSPIGSAALTLAYFDLRVRKEGFDLERLARGLGKNAPAAPAFER